MFLILEKMVDIFGIERVPNPNKGVLNLDSTSPLPQILIIKFYMNKIILIS